LKTIQELWECFKDFKQYLLADVLIAPWCSNCSNGFIKDFTNGAFPYVTKECSCKKHSDYHRKIREEFNSSNIYKQCVSTYDFFSYDESTITKEILYSFLSWESSKPRLYLYGTPWTWKTYTAMIILFMALFLEKTVLYTNVPQLLEDMRPSSEEKGRLWLEACWEVDVLVMDDLWQEKLSDWVREKLYLMINWRYINWKTTIFTSNTSLKKLQEKLWHEAVVSRLKWNCVSVSFSWADRRVTE